MGNKIARTTQASATEYYLHDQPSTYNLVLLDVVSRGRFLKSFLCKHDEGLLLVKVYFKRAGEPLDLKEHERIWRMFRWLFREMAVVDGVMPRAQTREAIAAMREADHVEGTEDFVEELSPDARRRTWTRSLFFSSEGYCCKITTRDVTCWVVWWLFF